METSKETNYPIFQNSQEGKICFGCGQINEYLKGGVPVGKVTEIVGNSSSGKSQICMQLGLTVQLPVDLGGLSAGAVIVWTRGPFPVQRLHEINSHFQEMMVGNLPISPLNNIFVEFASTSEELIGVLGDKLPALLSVRKIGLLVIDSLGWLYRSHREYMGRKIELDCVLRLINKLQKQQPMSVICVNEVYYDPTTRMNAPCLGNNWASRMDFRIKTCRRDGKIAMKGVGAEPIQLQIKPEGVSMFKNI